MRRLFSWAVDTFYPNHFFYNKNIFSKINFFTDEKVALVACAAMAEKVENVGDEYIATIHNVTDRGRQIGSFEIKIKRLE